MDQEKLFDKIEKLLALGDKSANSNLAQVEAALLKVNELLEKHRLDLSEIVGRKKEQPICHDMVRYWKLKDDGTLLRHKWNRWAVDLASGIGWSNYCEVLHSPSSATFIGTREDVDISIFMTQNLFARLVTLSKQAQKQYMEEYKEETGKSAWHQWGWKHPKRWRREWLEGAVSGVVDKIRKPRRDEIMKARREQEEALIVSDDKAIKIYMDEKMPWMKDREGLSSDDVIEAGGSWEAYEAGREAGENMQLQSGVGGSNRTVKAIEGGDK